MDFFLIIIYANITASNNINFDLENKTLLNDFLL